jgi:hypothetical protein
VSTNVTAPKQDLQSSMDAYLKMLGSSNSLPGPSFSLLSALLGSVHPQVEGQWFFNQDISLDGYQFVRCRFENCRITVSKGAFRLTNCLFTGCSFSFSGDAIQVVKSFNLTDLTKIPPTLRPLIYQDRTVTI